MDYVDSVMVLMIYMVPFLLLISTVGLITDYLVPRIPELDRWLERITDKIFLIDDENK